MIWPFKPRTTKKVARIEITGVIASETRHRVLKELETVKEKKFPALLLRIDSPGGTVGDSQEIYDALQKLRENVKIVGMLARRNRAGNAFVTTTTNPQKKKKKRKENN